jgi:hypothetical protein
MSARRATHAASRVTAAVLGSLALGAVAMPMGTAEAAGAVGTRLSAAVAPHGSSWQVVAPNGSSWQVVAPDGSSWQ